MTGWQIFCLILLAIGCLVSAFHGDWHRREHGVGPPTRKTLARIRRNARKKGISDGEAYNIWLRHKQRQAGLKQSSDDQTQRLGPIKFDQPNKDQRTQQIISPDVSQKSVAQQQDLGSVSRMGYKNWPTRGGGQFEHPSVSNHFDQYAPLCASDLSKLQIARRITASEMAAKIGISTMVLAQLQNGTRKMTPELRAKIETAFSLRQLPP